MITLLDRPVDFDYHYRIRCPACLGVNSFTADAWLRGQSSGHVKCSHCDAIVRMSLSGIALRDGEDQVLDDGSALAVAWYHTSPEPGWPSDSYKIPPSALDLLKSTLTPAQIEASCEQEKTKALHIGTYEAAIESMLRRMRDQDDGGTQFYLHRVALRDGIEIEPGWRTEEAAQTSLVTPAVLGAADAIRYVNVYESPGSISLALKRDAIGAVQGVTLPVGRDEIASATTVLPEIAVIRARIADLETARPAGLNSIELLRKQWAQRSGLPFIRKPTTEQYELLDHISQVIANSYLPGVSPSVRRKFTAALESWRQAQPAAISDAVYVSQFSSMAGVLTRHDQVLAALDRESARRF